MKQKLWMGAALSLVALSANQANAAEYTGPKVTFDGLSDEAGPEGTQEGIEITEKINQQYWEQFCTGDRVNLSDQIGPNYKNPTVLKAAENITKTGTEADSGPNYYMYFYGHPSVYGLPSNSALKNGKIPEKLAKQLEEVSKESGVEVNAWAHTLLTLTCGEFRDRTTMVKAKVQWYANMNILGREKQEKLDPTANPWLGINAQTYLDYVHLSQDLYDAKQEYLIGEEDPYKFKRPDGDFWSAPVPVPGITICETKYILGEYLPTHAHHPDEGHEEGEANEPVEAPIYEKEGFDKYWKGYQKFDKEHCTDDDRDHFYQFRGDSNLKQNSPEGNGMLWHGNGIARHCQTLNTARKSSKEKGLLTDETCAKYYGSPFTNRWMAARAGLSTWFFHQEKDSESFDNENDMVVIHNKYNDEKGVYNKGPLNYSLGFGEELITGINFMWKSITDAWNASDISLVDTFRLEAGEVTQTEEDREEVAKGQVYRSLRNAVNRHTDWYSSAYEDQFGWQRDQAYSPFVASSYILHASDEFTSPGITVSAPTDGRKHWMLIFKVHKDNWYNTKTLAESKEIKTPNFDRIWIDETTFGTNGLARSERAWDRMGTALEHEYDSILNLQAICHGWDSRVTKEGESCGGDDDFFHEF